MQNTGLHISTSSLKGSVHILCRKPWKEGRGVKGRGREREGREGAGGKCNIGFTFRS